jgi:hypothetical protein
MQTAVQQILMERLWAVWGVASDGVLGKSFDQSEILHIITLLFTVLLTMKDRFALHPSPGCIQLAL